MDKNSYDLIDTESPDLRVAALAAGQHGVFSRRQALAAGFEEHVVSYRVTSGRWKAVRPGVYRMNGTPDSWKQAIMAACLWAGDGAVASHVTAARLWDLEGLPWKTRDEPVHLSVPVPRHPTAPDVMVHRTRKLEVKDCSVRDGIPVTNLPRTLIDLSAGPASVKLELLLESALGQYRQFDLAWLKKTLRRLGPRGREGAGTLRALMDVRWNERPDLDSALERRMHALFLRSGLPIPVTHYNVVEEDRFLGEIDFAYPARRVAILTHGFAIHGRRVVWEKDAVQFADLSIMDWVLIPVTSAQLDHDEAGIVARIRKALATK